MNLSNRLKIAWSLIWNSKYIDKLNEKISSLQRSHNDLEKEYIHASENFRCLINCMSYKTIGKRYISMRNDSFISRTIEIPVLNETITLGDLSSPYNQECILESKIYHLNEARRIYQISRYAKFSLEEVVYDFVKKLIDEGCIKIRNCSNIENHTVSYEAIMYYYK